MPDALSRPPDAAAPALAQLQPMEAAREALPFVDAAWAFQLRPCGGQRVLLELGGERGVCLHSAHHVDITPWFPEVVEAFEAWPGGRTVLDAELCVLDAVGRNDAQRLHARCLMRGWRHGADAAGLVVRDVLVHDGQDLRGWPWSRRRRLLCAMRLDAARVHCARAVDGDGRWLHRQARALGGMDLLALRRQAPYRQGACADCLSIPAHAAGEAHGWPP
jgi:bifunctional non-homologous end joining protein LigD